MKKFMNMLFLGDYKANTGYGTVSKNLLPYFKDYYFRRYYNDAWKLNICAVNYFGDMTEEDKNTTVFSALKSIDFSKNSELRDDFGRHGFLHALYHEADPPTTNMIVKDGPHGKEVIAEEEQIHPAQIGYDAVFIIQDVPVITSIVPVMADIKRRFKQENKKDFKTIIYFPADHKLIPAFVKDLEFFDGIVTYNEYSREAVLRLAPHLRKKIRVIPHGTNTTDFYPARWTESDRVEKFRSEYFGDNAKKFIVTSVNRNQPRKDFPTLILGFEIYHRENLDSFLYLHTNPNDPLGHDLRAVLMQTDLQEGIDYALPPKHLQNHGFSVEDLNLVYNSSDVFITTTLGEGHGLSLTESMATGTPVICPLNTSFTEITDSGRRAYILEHQYPGFCSHFDNVIREMSDMYEVAEKLAEVHHDINTNSPALHSKVDQALKYVQSLTWQSVGEKWVELMKETY